MSPLTGAVKAGLFGPVFLLFVETAFGRRFKSLQSLNEVIDSSKDKAENNNVKQRKMIVVFIDEFYIDNIGIHGKNVNSPSIIFDKHPWLGILAYRRLCLRGDIGTVEFEIGGPSPAGSFVAVYLDFPLSSDCVDIPDIMCDSDSAGALFCSLGFLDGLFIIIDTFGVRPGDVNNIGAHEIIM